MCFGMLRGTSVSPCPKFLLDPTKFSLSLTLSTQDPPHQSGHVSTLLFLASVLSPCLFFLCTLSHHLLTVSSLPQVQPAPCSRTSHRYALGLRIRKGSHLIAFLLLYPPLLPVIPPFVSYSIP